MRMGLRSLTFPTGSDFHPPQLLGQHTVGNACPNGINFSPCKPWFQTPRESPGICRPETQRASGDFPSLQLCRQLAWSSEKTGNDYEDLGWNHSSLRKVLLIFNAGHHTNSAMQTPGHNLAQLFQLVIATEENTQRCTQLYVCPTYMLSE